MSGRLSEPLYQLIAGGVAATPRSAYPQESIRLPYQVYTRKVSHLGYSDDHATRCVDCFRVR
jgi:hypothetical protein